MAFHEPSEGPSYSNIRKRKKENEEEFRGILISHVYFYMEEMIQNGLHRMLSFCPKENSDHVGLLEFVFA